MLDSLFAGLALDALLIRMAATALVVMAVSWAVGAFGPLVGGALAGLPMILGPGFYFMAQQSPAPFVAQAASYALLSLCATQLFLLAYIATARHGSPWLSLLAAVGGWLAGALLSQLLPAHPVGGMLLFMLVTAGCLRLSRRYVTPMTPTKGVPGWGLLLLRGLLAGALVAAVTTASRWLGPSGSGFLLAFPIGYTVVSVTIHQKYGNAGVIATLRSALLGTLSLAGFAAALALTITRMPQLAALAVALASSLLITVVLVLRRRGRTAAAAAPRR